MVAEHSSIQSAMMLPELAALAVALTAMAFATWWFSRNGEEKKKVQRNTVQGIPENISLYVTATGSKVHAKECNFVSCHDPRTGTRLMKHGVKNMLPCLACQPFSSANLVVEHETKPESSHARIFSACGNCLVIHALGFLCIVPGIIISVDFQRMDAGTITGVREMPAQGIAHGDDRYKSFMDEIRRARVDEQDDARMDVPVRRTTKKKARSRRSSSVPTAMTVDDETELMQKEMVLQEKNYLEYKNGASMFHMAMEEDMEEEVYTNSYFKKNLREIVYYSLDLYRWLSVLANSSFYTMVFLSAPTGMIAWIISYFQAASALKRRELRRKHVSRRKVHLCRSGVGKTRRVCLMLVLVYTNMEVAKAMDQQLRQLAESASSAQQHLQSLIGALDAQHQEAHRTSEASAAASRQAFESTHQSIQASQEMMQQIQTRQEAQMKALQEGFQIQAGRLQEALVRQSVFTQEAIEASKAKKEEVQWRKLIKTPDVFGPSASKEERDQFPDWKHKMKTWLSAVEPELAGDLNKVESARDTPFPMADFTPRTKERSMKFYSILASYTKNKPLRVIKSMTDYNGLEAWRNLIQEHEPYTRGRGLALLNKVLNHKFDNKKTHLENLVAFEEAIENYETAANDVMSDDVKVSVVMNNMEGAVRQHSLLTVDSKTKFENIRKFLVTYEQTVRWTTADLINSGKDHGGQADMDVSRVKGKGKDKGSKGFKGKGKWRMKGKGKGGKGKWNENGFYKGRGRGFLKGRGRGGRKGQGRSLSSNKGKSKGKGNVLAGVCHYCGKPGHYESQCRKKERDLGGVREVQADSDVPHGRARRRFQTFPFG